MEYINNVSKQAEKKTIKFLKSLETNERVVVLNYFKKNKAMYFLNKLLEELEKGHKS